jgi:hypothetical protein
MNKSYKFSHIIFGGIYIGGIYAGSIGFTVAAPELKNQYYKYQDKREILKGFSATQPNYEYIDARGLSKPCILAELYNNSKPLGMGIHQYKKDVMTVEEARELLRIEQNLDYVKGRPIKTNFAYYPYFDSYTYDKRNENPGLMQKCIDNLKNGVVTNIIPREMPTQDGLNETTKLCNKLLIEHNPHLFKNM